MEKRWDAVCIGAALVDVPLKPVSKEIFDCESYPLDRIAMTIGGDAINEAAILSRLGCKSALISLVGDDAAGSYILDFCKKNNIDTSGVCTGQAIDTSINVGLVGANGERTFVTSRNGSLWKMSMEHVNLELLTNARLLSLASIFNNPLLDGGVLVKIFKAAKEQGLILCADVIKSRLGEGLADIREALGYLDYFFPNYEEAVALTGETGLEEIANIFLSCGIKNVIIKNGKHGCFIKTATETLSVPAYQGVSMADTIGAGDNFAAGFISAILDGRGLKECGEYANAVASIAVESVGATAGVESKAQADRRYAKYKLQTGGVTE